MTARDLDKIGTAAYIEKLKERVHGTRVYISLDIDVLDPAFAPATGTAEVGGWSTRELLTILDGLDGIDLIGADVGKYRSQYFAGLQNSLLTIHTQSKLLLHMITLVRLQHWRQQKLSRA